MKFLILTALLFSICGGFFPVTGNLSSNELISQSGTVNNQKVKKDKAKKSSKPKSCSIKKCSIT